MRALVALVVVLAALVPSAVPADEAPTLAISIRFDVAVVDARGRAVSNLKASDFELTVDGAPQAIDSVAAIDGSRKPQPRAFALFLDEYHTRAADAERIRAALTRFVDANLTASDRVIVFKPLDSLLTIAVASDLSVVRDAIASFDGRLGDYEPRTPFEREFMARSPETVERLRRQVTVSALNALAVRLGGLGEGRKAILLVSEGFVDARPMRGEEMLPTLDSVVRIATREQVAIYTLDPSANGGGRDVLRTIASDTDGRAARDDADLDASLQRLAADSSTYYLLTLRPAAPADGRFHAVQVRVKRPNVRVRARKGFWAIEPDEALRLTRTETPDPPFERTPRHASALIRPWFGMTRAAGGNTRVTFVWEPARRVPGDRTRAGSPAEVAITASTLDGSTIYAGTVRPTGAIGETRGRDAKAEFDAPPGRLFLQLSIAGANAKTLDVDTRDLSVRDLREPVAIGTPEILRARSAREFRALAGDLDAAPVAAREFSRAERLLVRFSAYAPDGDTAAISARLISRAGSTMRTLQPVGIGPSSFQIDVPLAGFAPGEYTIELAAAADGATAKEVVTFRVTF